MNKDQFVIACVESAESAAIVLPWARHFAECLNHKGLMVLHVSTTATDDSWLKELGVPFVSMRGDWRTAIEGIPTAFNGILAVAAVNPAAPRTSLTHPKKLLHEFKNCKTAYLVVGSRRSESGRVEESKSQKVEKSKSQRVEESLSHPDSQSPGDSKTQRVNFNFPACSQALSTAELNIISEKLSTFNFSLTTSLLTMTHRREGKEKLVWASYLARFLGSRITIAHPDYRDGDLRMRWKNNMRFVDKMFTPLGITYTDAVAYGDDHKNLDLLQPDLLIARTSDPRERDIVDLLSPLPEYRLLIHPSHTPILFLNPRDDLYILCD